MVQASLHSPWPWWTVALAVVGCGPTPAVLELPAEPWARSAVFALADGADLELWALDLERGAEAFQVRSKVERALTAEALLYEAPLAELRLAPGPLPLAESATGRRVPGAREVFTSQVTAAGAVSPWAIAREPTPQLQAVRLEGFDCPTWIAEDFSGLPDQPQALVSIGQRRALVFYATEIHLFSPDAGLRVLTSTSPGYVLSAVRGAGDELWVSTPGLLAALAIAEGPAGPDLGVRRVRVAAPAFRALGYSPEVGVVGITEAGAVYRYSGGAVVEHVLTLPGAVGGSFNPSVARLSDGRLAVVSPGSSRVAIVGRDDAAIEDPGFGLGMLAVGEIEGFGVVAGAMGALLHRSAAGKWTTIDGVTLAGRIYFFLPIPGGIFYGGAAGLVAAYLPTAGHCPATQVRSYDIVLGVALGEGEILLSGAPLAPNAGTVTRLSRSTP